MFDSFAPAFIIPCCFFRIHGRFKTILEFPARYEFFFGIPYADSQASQISGAESRRFDDLRTIDRNAEDIGLELHEHIVGNSAAIDFEGSQFDARVCFHGAEDIFRLVSHRIESCTNDVRFLSAARDADDQAAGIHIPVGSAETDECRYDIDAVRVGNAFSDPFRIRSRVDEAQAVAEPLDSRAGDEDRAFQSIFDFTVEAPGNGRDQAVLGRNRRRARVQSA